MFKKVEMWYAVMKQEMKQDSLCNKINIKYKYQILKENPIW